MSVGFYCLSYMNKRREAMEKVFGKLGITAEFYSGVAHDDPRLKNAGGMARTWSMTYGHLELIKQFHESWHEYGIICEDDILIRNDFRQRLPEILFGFDTLGLDILMLGYLCENPIDTYSNFPTLLDKARMKYLGYPDGLWGGQMYLISRDHAGFLLEKFSGGYAERSLTEAIPPFSPDWTITKEGRRALLYPLLVVEKYYEVYDDEHQNRSHLACYNYTYRPELFD